MLVDFHTHLNLEAVLGSDVVSLTARPHMLQTHHIRAQNYQNVSPSNAKTGYSHALHKCGCTWLL